MAKGGKLTKLTSILKKLNSFSKQSGPSGRSNRDGNTTISPTRYDSSSQTESDHNHQHLHAVYVGKSRRKYLINNEVIGHPLFQELVARCEDYGDNLLVIGCEVVMFEHLLWMIDNVDSKPESLDELVDFYAC